MRIRGEVSVYHLIQKLQHGYQILSHVNWVSHSRFHISVAGILGVAGLILAIRDGKKGNFRSLLWLPQRKDDSEKLCLVAGLKNHGNNCFLNVILQALAGCSSFLPFLQSIIEEDDILVEKRIESMPLTDALVTLLEELCILREGKMVLSPRKVMLAMDLYIPNFNLTSQQDAAEAFLHLLSSLKEEFSECYSPHYGSLADIVASPFSRISITKRSEGQNEWERWQQHFLGPFDGILGSFLTCKSCSVQLSMDFEFFHSLPLSPLLDSSATIIDGCTVEDCLKRFTVAEYIENYHCNQCWHLAAMKYLSSIGRNEAQVEQLRCCVEEDSCPCRDIFRQEALPWSNDFSRTFKQLSIARCPKILCIHLQRASMNEYGELVKLQGHISFPLILDLFPFTKDAVGVGIESLEKDLRGMNAKRQHQPPIPHLSHFKMQLDAQTLQRIYGLAQDDVSSKALVEDALGYSVYKPSSVAHSKPFEGEPGIHLPVGCSDFKFTDMHLQSVDKVSKNCNLAPSKSYMYRLVSVVEHFGRAGSGHYTIYRRVRGKLDNEDSGGQYGPAHVHWFCASDSEVLSVSEKDVLAAEASLLFYERIVEPK